MTRETPVLVEAFLERSVLTDPAGVARTLDGASFDEAIALLETHPALRWGGVFKALSSERGAALIQTLHRDTARQLLEEMEPTIAALLLARADEEAREELLGTLSAAVATELRSILSFPPSTAGRLMDPRVLAFSGQTTASEVLERIRATSWKRIFEIFVVDEQGTLTGSVPLQEVAVASTNATLSSLKSPPSTVVHGMTTREEVAELLDTRKLPVIPVTDLDGKLLGVIRYDALMAATQAEASVDIQTMVGASKEERALSKTMFAVKKRLPWLEINLATAFLAASVVGMFESLIAQFTALAVLLPVVAGQSGNTGAQALAVTMRGLALREIRVSHWARVLFKEFRVGLLNGVAVALTTSFFVYLWSRSIGLGLVIGISMILSMSLAGLSGGAIPMLLTALKQDPAQSSSIILTTVTDVVGFFSFLGIATMLSRFL